MRMHVCNMYVYIFIHTCVVYLAILAYTYIWQTSSIINLLESFSLSLILTQQQEIKPKQIFACLHTVPTMTNQYQIANLSTLLEKMTSVDKDFRFMATNDLMSELKNDSIKLDDDSERKVCVLTMFSRIALIHITLLNLTFNALRLSRPFSDSSRTRMEKYRTWPLNGKFINPSHNIKKFRHFFLYDYPTKTNSFYC